MNPPYPMTRKPAAYRSITCIGADGKEYGRLCYCARRGEIIEPMSHEAAEPKIGPIQGWYYDEPNGDK